MVKANINIHDLIITIHDYVGDNETQQAIIVLIRWIRDQDVKNPCLKDLAILSANLKELDTCKQRGTISFKKYQKQANELRERLLNILENVAKDFDQLRFFG